MKKGESEAKTILESIGVRFRNDYTDDNSKEKMPDLRYADGRYLEVTHTKHNNSIFQNINQFWRLPIEKIIKINEEYQEAQERICHAKRAHVGAKWTYEELNQFHKDAALIKKHIGYDVFACREKFSEFKCDIPVISYSADNVMYEITEDKEYEYFFEIFIELKWNGVARTRFEQLLHSL